MEVFLVFFASVYKTQIAFMDEVSTQISTLTAIFNFIGFSIILLAISIFVATLILVRAKRKKALCRKNKSIERG